MVRAGEGNSELVPKLGIRSDDILHEPFVDEVGNAFLDVHGQLHLKRRRNIRQ